MITLAVRTYALDPHCVAQDWLMRDDQSRLMLRETSNARNDVPTDTIYSNECAAEWYCEAPEQIFVMDDDAREAILAPFKTEPNEVLLENVDVVIRRAVS